ncbi:hypothetical protein [Pseudomonas phage Almagne]|nr:hypothetical protein [Pseudomonas phage Almagne]
MFLELFWRQKMAFKIRKTYRRRPFKRVRYPSQPIDVIEVKYYDTGFYDEGIEMTVRPFEVYRNGTWVGTFDTSPRSMVEFAEAVR